MKLSITEENYLKAIFKLSEKDKKAVSTNAIAKEMQTSAASVTDMLKRLAEKELIKYKKYKGVSLSEKGTKTSTSLVRKHRLWEVFLVDKLDFGWDEVHEIAEQLEHIDSAALVNRLDAFLNYPKFDPHGDPIPSADGKFTLRSQQILTEVTHHTPVLVVGVKEHSAAFLRHLDEMDIHLGQELEVLEQYAYDDSISVRVGDRTRMISAKVGRNIFVKMHAS
jgi:DtxR family Mn-dependent transcriptional regulator